MHNFIVLFQRTVVGVLQTLLSNSCSLRTVFMCNLTIERINK